MRDAHELAPLNNPTEREFKEKAYTQREEFKEKAHTHREEFKEQSHM
jgi:hypothetical protein